jgi:hypothetical protein
VSSPGSPPYIAQGDGESGENAAAYHGGGSSSRVVGRRSAGALVAPAGLSWALVGRRAGEVVVVAAVVLV